MTKTIEGWTSETFSIENSSSKGEPAIRPIAFDSTLNLEFFDIQLSNKSYWNKIINQVHQWRHNLPRKYESPGVW